MADFGSLGLWEYNGNSWSKLTRLDPDNTGNTTVNYDGGLAVDFGTQGLWLYKNGTWEKINNINPQHLDVLAGNLMVDFGTGTGLGLWEYDDTRTPFPWKHLTSADPDNIGNTMVTVEF